MSQKKFANLHYPGMKADPRETRSQRIAEPALWRMQPQALCIGEEAQAKLLSSSALILGATPLGVAIAKKLLRDGFGKVGIFRENTIDGSHGLMPKPSPEGGLALKVLSQWARAEAPWALFEAFGDTTADRQLQDLLPGFQFLIDTGESVVFNDALSLYRSHEVTQGKAAVSARVHGRVGWLFAVAIINDATTAPSTPAVPTPMKAAVDENSGSPGIYYPLIDFVANRAQSWLFDFALAPGATRGISLKIEAQLPGWQIQEI